MNNLFEGVVRYTKELNDARYARVNEKFIFNAITFSHAEEILFKEIGETVKGEFTLQKLNPMNRIIDVILLPEEEYNKHSESTLWKVKFNYNSVDAEKPKDQSGTILVEAPNSEMAADIAGDFIDEQYHSTGITHISNTKALWLRVDEVGQPETSDESSDDQELESEE